MNNDITAILNNNDTSMTYFDSFSVKSGNISTHPRNQYFVAILENGCYKSLNGYLHSGITTVYELLNHQSHKEKLYLTAVDNLIKKNEFLQLTIQLDQELISEEEFQEELEKNENKYLIRMKDEYNETDFMVATDILPQLNRTFSVDEVSELFSIPIENINFYLDSKLVKENS